jgi:pyroglutamyl-peptidase
MTEKGLILLTGFEAFREFKVNPSIVACRLLDGRVFNGYKVKVEKVTMKFDGVKEEIEGHIREYSPSAVICTGVSGRGSTIAVERVAINVFSAPKSIMGVGALDRPIREDGPDAFFTTLPYRNLLEALKDSRIPARLSNTAGTVGCNLIFYYVMDYLSGEGRHIPAGFVHVPRLPEQALDGASASMTSELSSKALDTIVRALTQHMDNSH